MNVSDSNFHNNTIVEVKTLYKKALLIRKFEEKIVQIYHTNVIKSPVHLSIGQEAVSVGVCAALAKDDVVSGTYRGHAVHIAKGGNLNKMMAELYGKKDGCGRGKAGSMHLIEMENGLMGGSAILGSNVPIATGYAMALKREAKKTGKQRVMIIFFGDGATEEGSFSESINFAALHKLPIIFLCENNKLAIHNPIENRWSTDKICERVAAYGMKTHRITDGDIFKIKQTTQQAVEEIKSNPSSGPIFIECFTCRYREHVGPNEDLHKEKYYDLDEYKQWLAKDPVDTLKNLLPENIIAEIHQEVTNEIENSIKFAENSPFPGEEDLYQHVYAPKEIVKDPEIRKDGQKFIRYVDAIAEACIQEIERDKRVFVFGVDVDDHKKIQDSTAGIEKFGADHLFGTPISEDAMTGVAIGAAMYGLRPVHVHIRMDFLALAANQIINTAAKAHYMYGGDVKVPLVVRCIIGRSWGQGAQHSQALHSLFAHIPGLKVVAPSNAYDAKGCLVTAIRDNNPVIFMEHRLLHGVQSYVPAGLYENEVGKGRIVMPGDDITVVGISHMALEVTRAANFLKAKGINAEVIDPIWISPLDINLIKQSVEKTGKLLIVDNGWLECGISAEIIARVYEELPNKNIQVSRMGFAPTPCPTTRSLEVLFYPNSKTISEKICTMLTKKIDFSDFKTDNNNELEQFKGPF